MKFFLSEIFLAWRYFKPKRNAVSIITVISIVGVALGVCVLMVVLSIMTGFTNEIKSKILDTTPHIEVLSYYSNKIDDPYPMIKKIDALGAKAVAFSQGEVLVQSGKQVSPMLLVGIDPYEEPSNNFIKRSIVDGSYSLNPGDIMVSYILANQLGLQPGSKLIIHSPAKLSEMVKFGKNGQLEANNSNKVYLPTEFTVAGIFNTGLYTYDSKVIVTDINDANDLFGLPWGSASMIAINTNNPFNLTSIYNEISSLFPEYRVLTWKQLNKDFLNVLAVEKNMMFFVLIFIILVAASSITNTLITVVVQKTREIGLLRSLGVTSGSVMRIFILQGFFVGIIGTIVGLFLGWQVILWRMDILNFMSNVFHIELFPKQFYFLSSLPASISPNELWIISICTIILCTLGAFIPAYRAAKLDPAKALRYE